MKNMKLKETIATTVGKTNKCAAYARLFATSALLSGLALQSAYADTDYSDCKAEKLTCDRQAILNMSGGYRVNFDFVEVTALAENYELKPSKSDGADEYAFVVTDTPKFVSLQHILEVGDGEVVKHWRQDWQYEPKTIWQYEGNDTWKRYRLTPEQSQGKWLQTVWQVDDSPRYASLGEWQHKNNSHIWNGGETYRPLPRREYSTREDYDVLRALNSHDIGTSGWVHLQNNLKQSGYKADSTYVARELGFNTYEKDADAQFVDAKAYWGKTAPFWEAVRAHWENTINNASQVSTVNQVNDKKMFEALFKAAKEYGESVEKGNQPSGDLLTKNVANLVGPFIKASELKGGINALPVFQGK